MHTEFARVQMITQQVRAWDVLDERVLDAMRRVPREFFVPERFAGVAFADADVPLRDGQHMLAPKVVGRLLQALNAAPGMLRARYWACSRLMNSSRSPRTLSTGTAILPRSPAV